MQLKAQLTTILPLIQDYFVTEKCIYLKPNPGQSLLTLEQKTATFSLPCIFVSNIPYDARGQVQLDLLQESKPLAIPQRKILVDEVLAQTLATAAMQDLIPQINSQENTDLSILNGAALDLTTWPETLAQALKNAAQTANKIIFITNEEHREELSYALLLEKAKASLVNLQAEGVKQDDVVIFHLESSMRFIILFWACMLGGMIPLPIPLIKYYEKDDDICQLLPYLHEELNGLTIISKQTDNEKLSTYLQQINLSAKLIASETSLTSAHCVDFANLNTRSPALMLMTSGSTDKPKLVVHKQQSLIARSAGSIIHNQFNSQDISLNWFAFDHVGALVMYHIHDVILGASQIHVSTNHILEKPLRWLDYLNQYRVTNTWAPSFAYELIVKQLSEQSVKQQYDLSALRFILNGGEAINVKSARRFLQACAQYNLPSTSMHPAWGMSETASGVLFADDFLLVSTHDSDVFANIGFTIPGASVRIVDAHNQLLPQGIKGKLQVKCLSLMQSYWHDIKSNQPSFTSDGWFDTGDLAILSCEGVKFVGRDKDIVIINGRNFSCAEIELKLAEFSTNRAVIPIQIEDAATETVLVFVALKSNATISNIKTLFTRDLGVTPHYVLALTETEFPKTTIGKIRKSQLKNNFYAGLYHAQRQSYDEIYHPEKLIPNWFFETYWQAKAVNHTVNQNTATTILFLDTLSTIEYQTVADHTITFGDVYAEHGKDFTINAQQSDDLNNLFYQLTQKQVALQQVIYVSTTAFTLHKKNDVPAHLEFITIICQQLLRNNRDKVRFVYHSQYNDARAHAAATLLKSFANENAKFSAKIIYSDQAELNELSNLSDDEVAFIEHLRHVPALRSIPCQLPIESACLQANGFYMITGGMGAIAYEIAKYLVMQFNADLLLLGRNEKIDEIKLAALKNKNNKIIYLPTYIEDEAALQHAVQSAKAQIAKPLTAIIHAAGTYSAHGLEQITHSDIQTFAAAKITGTINLLRLLAKEPEASLINISSVNGYFGAAHAALYAAANAFLDALADGKKIRSLAFSMWHKFGLSKQVDFAELTKRRGFELLNYCQGKASFLLALNTTKSTVLIGLNADNPHIQAHLYDSIYVLEKPTSNVVALKESTTEFIQTKSLDHNAYMLQTVKQIWLKALDLDDITITDNFFDLGAHSLMLPQVQVELNQALSIELNMVDIFKHPNVASLTQFIVRHDGNAKVDEGDGKKMRAHRQALLKRRK